LWIVGNVLSIDSKRNKMFTVCRMNELGRLLLRRGHASDDIRITGVCDAEGRDAEVLAAGGAQLYVVAGVVVHARLGEHRVVLNLTLPQGRRVVGDDDELGLALAQRLERLAVAEHVLATLHHQRQPSVDALDRLLRFFLGNHFEFCQAKTRSNVQY